MALGITYLKGIEAAGGLPVVMPPMAEDAIEPLLDRLDGICLSGGPDLDPALYEEEPHPELGRSSPTSTASSSPSPPAPTPARCRSWRSAAAPRR